MSATFVPRCCGQHSFQVRSQERRSRNRRVGSGKALIVIEERRSLDGGVPYSLQQRSIRCRLGLRKGRWSLAQVRSASCFQSTPTFKGMPSNELEPPSAIGNSSTVRLQSRNQTVSCADLVKSDAAPRLALPSSQSNGSAEGLGDVRPPSAKLDVLPCGVCRKHYSIPALFGFHVGIEFSTFRSRALISDAPRRWSVSGSGCFSSQSCGTS